MGGWRRLPKRLGRLLSVTNAIEAVGVRGTVIGHRPRPLEGGGGCSPPSNASLPGGGQGPPAAGLQAAGHNKTGESDRHLTC